MHNYTVTPAELEQYLASLPVDDEPLSDHERRALEEHRRNPRATLSTEELERRLEEYRARPDHP
jgi:hypothetical protein